MVLSASFNCSWSIVNANCNSSLAFSRLSRAVFDDDSASLNAFKEFSILDFSSFNSSIIFCCRSFSAFKLALTASLAVLEVVAVCVGAPKLVFADGAPKLVFGGAPKLPADVCGAPKLFAGGAPKAPAAGAPKELEVGG